VIESEGVVRTALVFGFIGLVGGAAIVLVLLGAWR
jgi:hypothetical protein